jgi:hypothetical protein
MINGKNHVEERLGELVFNLDEVAFDLGRPKTQKNSPFRDGRGDLQTDPICS